jgi:hypothetical protein
LSGTYKDGDEIFISDFTAYEVLTKSNSNFALKNFSKYQRIKLILGTYTKQEEIEENFDENAQKIQFLEQFKKLICKNI